MTTELPPSYPLWTLQASAAPEWAINLLADLYEIEIQGTHGFGVRHPRAPWLLLVVSSVERCACGERARWEEMGGPAFCPRCADAEIALVAAEQLRREAGVPEPIPAYETEPTQVEAFVPMAHLPRPGALSLLCALALAVLGASTGCATAPRPVEVEVVGQLSASSTHVTVQALKHDAPPEFAGVVDSGDDVGEMVTTVVRAPDADADVTPEVAPKTDGVVTGEVR